MKIIIHELAVDEFEEAIEWYEMQSKGLGKRFKKAVMGKIKTIKEYPDCFLKEAENIYKAYIPKFPYKILYSIENDRMIIWAIAHMHRKPWYWQSRMI